MVVTVIVTISVLVLSRICRKRAVEVGYYRPTAYSCYKDARAVTN